MLDDPNTVPDAMECVSVADVFVASESSFSQASVTLSKHVKVRGRLFSSCLVVLLCVIYVLRGLVGYIATCPCNLRFVFSCSRTRDASTHSSFAEALVYTLIPYTCTVEGFTCVGKCITAYFWLPLFLLFYLLFV